MYLARKESCCVLLFISGTKKESFKGFLLQSPVSRPRKQKLPKDIGPSSTCPCLIASSFPDSTIGRKKITHMKISFANYFLPGCDRELSRELFLRVPLLPIVQSISCNYINKALRESFAARLQLQLHESFPCELRT